MTYVTLSNKKPPVESGGLILEEVESTPPNPENEY